jgi:hypothetical protein
MIFKTWSYAATGFVLTITGLHIGQALLSTGNRPNIYRGPAGEAVLGVTGLTLTLLMFFFGFRIFWDNAWWGLIQLPLAALASGFLTSMSWLNNGLTPIIFAGLGIAQAIKIF